MSEVASNLDEPWEITWGPDDHIWYTQHRGSVCRLNPNTGDKKVLLTIPEVHYERSRGLLSMVLHPDFDIEPLVYVHYTYIDATITSKDNIRSKLVRYQYRPGKDTLISPEIMVTNIPGNLGHNGSRMTVTVDKKIILATGDVGNRRGSQDETIISGKMLRINLDGSVPDDNPRAGSYVYSIGHRNAQGIVYARDRIYSSEHGPNNDDEINIIRAGRNYGWPNVEGFCDKENELIFCDSVIVSEPLITWTPTIAPAGLDFYDHTSIPEWRNSLILTSLKGRSLRVLALDDSGEKIVNEKIYLQKQFGRIRDLCVSPSGDIYLSTSNTDWHPKSQVWMYDSLPTEGDDRIIKLSKVETPGSKYSNLSMLKEDSAQMQLFNEDYEITVNLDIPGASLYVVNCAPCHMPNGKGIPNFVPPLLDTEWVSDKNKLITTTLGGLTEEIEVKGLIYNEDMPGFAVSLNDSEIADLLNFVRTSLNDLPETVTANEVTTIRNSVNL